MSTENWRDIPGFEGRYQVSDLGRVRAPGGLLATQDQGTGYLIVHLYLRGVRRARTVHRLVAETFVPGFFDGAHVNHLNGRKQDNRAVNLEWTTRSGNMSHAFATGLARAPRQAVIGTPLAGGPDVEYGSQIEAEIALSGRQSSAVHHCLIGKKKSAYGFTWRRA